MENMYYEEIMEDEDYQIENKFYIKDLESADWAMKKIQENNRLADERIQYAKDEIEKSKAFIKKEEEARDRSNFYLQGLLAIYMQERKAEDPKFKIKTPTGTVSTRKSTKWNYEDDLLLEFLKANKMNDYIRVKEEVNKNDFKKAVKITDSGKVVTQDGELVEGVSVEKSEDINIKFN